MQETADLYVMLFLFIPLVWAQILLFMSFRPKVVTTSEQSSPLELSNITLQFFIPYSHIKSTI